MFTPTFIRAAAVTLLFVGQLCTSEATFAAQDMRSAPTQSMSEEHQRTPYLHDTELLTDSLANETASKIQPTATSLSQKLSETDAANFALKLRISVLSQQVSTLTTELARLKDDIYRLDQKRLASSTFLHTGISKHLLSALAIAFSLVLSFFLFQRLRTSQQNDKQHLSELIAQSQHANEEMINTFSQYVENLQMLTEQSVTAAKEPALPNMEAQHALVKAIADNITFIEVTLSRMDTSVRGFKQLTKSIHQMKDRLRQRGYDIIEMLGKPYNSGMKVVANFIEDEDLEAGTQIITGITKPQINYNGIMIQSAQIVVTQNI